MARLAGFFAAHAVWSVSDGATLITIFATEDASGVRSMTRLVNESIEAAVAEGKRRLDAPAEGVLRAVLLYDGIIAVDDAQETDAIMIEARSYADGHGAAVLAVPYRPAQDPGGFAVFRLQFLTVEPPGADARQMAVAFWAGVDGHDKGAEVWDEHLEDPE
jgi:hypothetical protein